MNTPKLCDVQNSHIPEFLSEELGFRNTIINGFPDPLACIPDFKSRIHDSTSNNCPNSAFHEQTFPWLWNQDLLTSEATQPWKQIWYKNAYVSLSAGHQSMRLFWFCFFFFPFVYLLCHFLVILQFLLF